MGGRRFRLWSLQKNRNICSNNTSSHSNNLLSFNDSICSHKLKLVMPNQANFNEKSFNFKSSFQAVTKIYEDRILYPVNKLSALFLYLKFWASDYVHSYAKNICKCTMEKLDNILTKLQIIHLCDQDSNLLYINLLFSLRSPNTSYVKCN